MGVVTLLRFLIGDREAILRIAGDRNALWIGLVFVLSAGFAREYDGEDLWAEPWHLLIPLGASLVASAILFLMIHDCAIGKAASRPWPSFSDYLSFLGLFWMTAPLAWLYAIPYERFLGAQAAIDANLTTLAVVAAWRVFLMIRVAVVCARIPALGAVGVVLCMGSILFVVAAIIQVATDTSIAFFMGGVRSSGEGPDTRTGAILNLGCLAFFACLGWAWLAHFFRGREGWQAAVEQAPSPPTTPLVTLVAVSLLIWASILPFTQPEQQRRRAAERAVRAKDYQGAARLLTDTPREAFPPHWAPPLPRRLPFTTAPELREVLGMLQALHESEGPEWAKARYLRRLGLILEQRFTAEMLELLAEALPTFPEGASLLNEARTQEKPAEPKSGDSVEEYVARYGAIRRHENLREIITFIDGKKPK